MDHSDAHYKCLSVVPDAAKYVEHYQRLEASGLGPRLVGVTDRHICVAKHQTLRQWVDERLIDGCLPDESRRAMGRELIVLLEKVHDLGFCHRDTHIRNFVVREGVPILVDPKYAVESRGPACYDLEGPEGSGVDIPWEHRSQGDNVNHHGVWWENADPTSEALLSTFGTIAELRSD